MLLACAGCGGAPPAPTAAAGAGAALEPASDRLGVLRAADETGFAVAGAPRQFRFPQDHGPHPAFRHEWWYLTGQLAGADGRRFGFEVTFFRLALRPPPASGAVRGPGWRSRQVYAAHFAVTDVAGGRFFNATRYQRDALGLALAEAEPFAVRVADWFLLQAPGPADAPGTALHWQLQAADAQYQLQLDLEGRQPPVLNGAGGLSRKADKPGAASYYYSMPRLQASGRLGGPGGSVAGHRGCVAGPGVGQRLARRAAAGLGLVRAGLQRWQCADVLQPARSRRPPRPPQRRHVRRRHRPCDAAVERGCRCRRAAVWTVRAVAAIRRSGP